MVQINDDLLDLITRHRGLQQEDLFLSLLFVIAMDTLKALLNRVAAGEGGSCGLSSSLVMLPDYTLTGIRAALSLFSASSGTSRE